MQLAEMAVRDFAGLLASDAPAPGGGAAAALSGALGIALTNMVGALTEGREKYAGHAQFVAGLNARARSIRESFLALADEDAETFLKAGATYKLPKGTAGEKAARKSAIQSALKECASAPFKMMELCAQAIELTSEAVGKTNANVASDLGVAALCLKAALQGAWLNVAVNLGSIEDAAFAGELSSKCRAILDRAVPAADGVYSRIEAAYGPCLEVRCQG